MDYPYDTTVTWGMLNDFAEHWPQSVVYLNMPSWFWPLVFAGVVALLVIACCIVVRTVMDVWDR